MSIKDLIPWNRGRGDLAVRRNEEAANPFLTLQREMNRLFDDAFRGFDVGFPTFGERQFGGGFGWPNLEVSEGSNEVKVTAELSGLEEKDVNIHLADGVLTISGEKKTEAEDKDRMFSERYYGRFERRIPVEDVDVDKVKASFKNGVLTVTLPRWPTVKSNVHRIAINGNTARATRQQNSIFTSPTFMFLEVSLPPKHRTAGISGRASALTDQMGVERRAARKYLELPRLIVETLERGQSFLPTKRSLADRRFQYGDRAIINFERHRIGVTVLATVGERETCRIAEPARRAMH